MVTPPTIHPTDSATVRRWKLYCVVGVFIGGIAGWFLNYGLNYRQTVAAEKSLARATGKDSAELTILRMYPHQRDVPPSLHVKNSVTTDSIRFRDLDQLLMVGPGIHFKNTGPEPIDAIRVETRMTACYIDVGGLPAEAQFAKMTKPLRQAETEEYALGQKLLTRQEGTVSMVRGLVGQLVQAQATDERSGRDHYGKFEVKVTARLVGATAFDVAVGECPLEPKFLWVPTGFPEDRCKKLLADMKPYVVIYEAAANN